jgi:hypothetical protein
MHEAESPRRKPTAAEPESADVLAWEQDVPLLNNRFIWWDFLRVFGISIAAIEALVLAMSYFIDGDPVLLPPMVWAIPLAILFGLFVLVGLIYRNRFPMHFEVDSKRVRYEVFTRMGRYERTVNTVFGVVAFLSLGLRGLGARIFGAGGGDEIKWHDVYRVTVHRRERVITLSNSWRSVIRLYCPAGQFEDIAARVQDSAAKAAVRRAKRAKPAPRRPLYFTLGWVIVAILATLTCGAWYEATYDGTDRMGLLAGILVLIVGLANATWWSKLVAFPALGVSLYYLGRLVMVALDPITSSSGSFLGYTYTLDTSALAVALVGGLVLAALSALRLFLPMPVAK